MLFILSFGEINTVTYGPEPFRRCGNCIGEDGEKLKRCANSEEVYCSKECQVLAWEKGHKKTLQQMQVKKY